MLFKLKNYTILPVSFIAVLKSPKNIKKKKDWAKKYAITKNKIHLNYRFKINRKQKKCFSDFWIHAFPNKISD